MATMLNDPQSIALEKLSAGAADGQLSASAVDNIRAWLVEPRYADYRPQVIEHLADRKFAELNAAFWTVLPFGTGGRRGRMYPIGSAVMNDRTVGESAQGLAEYYRVGWLGQRPSAAGALPQPPSEAPLACAIACDTRHRSRDFARLSAEIMAAAGYQVFFLDGYRSTPELSFAVRYKRCTCGIMITASHNPPAENGFKAYGPSGGQLVPPDDTGVIERVMAVDVIRRTAFDEAVAAGAIVLCQDEVDAAFQAAVVAQSLPGPRTLKIIYSPLHGVGATAVLPVLAAAGFRDVELFGPHAEPDGDFPNVPGHVSNPENPAVFDTMIARGKQIRADLAMATDPDCDRLGCAAPLGSDLPLGSDSSTSLPSRERLGEGKVGARPSPDPSLTGRGVPTGPWETFTGNQIGALLADYVLSRRQAAGTLTSEHYVVKTLVTTELIRRIADAYGVRCLGNLQVGFKWIGQTMDEAGPDKFVFGAEESHGFLVGQYARDKDAAVAAMLLAELAATAKAAGETLHQRLDGLFRRFGCHAEKTISLTMPGEQGMEDMKHLMARFRESPPSVLADLRVTGMRDYLNLTQRFDSKSVPLDAPRGDMIMLDLSSDGNYVAVRPSGTEPKVKFYMFGFHPPEDGADLPSIKKMLADRLGHLEHDLRGFAAS